MNEVIKTIYCLKFKKRIGNINTEKVLTNNRRWRIFTKCIKCKTSKSKLVNYQCILKQNTKEMYYDKKKKSVKIVFFNKNR